MRIHRLVVLALGLFLAGAVAAQPRPNVFDDGNRWTITAFRDFAPNHAFLAEHTLCFFTEAPLGSHIRGVWVSTTLANWRGRWEQEGDHLVMHGEFGTRIGHDSMVLELFAGPTPNDQAAGDWMEWVEGTGFDTTINAANARLQRAGSCPPLPGLASDPTKATPEELEKAVAALAASIPPLLKPDGKPAQSPMEASQQPASNK